MDGLKIDENTFITLDTEQNITGRVIFNDSLVIEGDVNVGGLVSGVNISRLDKERVTLDTYQKIYGDFVIEGNVIGYGNLAVNSTVNGEDLGEYRNNLHKFVLHAWSYGRNISEFAKALCPAFHYVKDQVLGGKFKVENHTFRMHMSYILERYVLYELKNLANDCRNHSLSPVLLKTFGCVTFPTLCCPNFGKHPLLRIRTSISPHE